MINNAAGSAGTPPILVGTALAVDDDDNATQVVHDVDSSPNSVEAIAGGSSAPSDFGSQPASDFGSQPEQPADWMFGSLPDTQALEPLDEETQAY